MKRFFCWLLLGAVVIAVSGCASEGYHTPHQQAAQRSMYDQMRHTERTFY